MQPSLLLRGHQLRNHGVHQGRFPERPAKTDLSRLPRSQVRTRRFRSADKELIPKGYQRLLAEDASDAR